MNNQSYTIYGSGFGIYGYLPAILKHSPNILYLPKDYYLKIKKRPELRKFLTQIYWKDNKDLCLINSKKIIISIPPKSQKLLIKSFFQKLPKDILAKKMIYLEKPICENPEGSKELIKVLNEKKISYKINYSFLYTDWFSNLKKNFLDSKNHIVINWNFIGNHFLKKINWKGYHDLGGGVLRFYSIHIIALAAYFNFSKFVDGYIEHYDKKKLIPKKMFLRISNIKGCILEVNIDSFSTKKEFNISIDGENKLNLRNPFESKSIDNNHDIRIPVLENYLYGDDLFDKRLYETVIDLWFKIEKNINIKND